MKDFCGCCGRETKGFEWCRDCEKHILKDGPPWDRTWFAQFNTDCPFQIGGGPDGGMRKAA